MKVICVSITKAQQRFLADTIKALKVKKVLFQQVYYYPDFEESHKPSSGELQNQKHKRRFFQKLYNFTSSLPSVFSSPLKGSIQYLYKGSLFSVLYWIARYTMQKLKTNRYLRQIKPDILIIPVDAVFYETGIWIKMAKKLSIKVVLIPFDMVDKEALAKERFQNFVFHGLLFDNLIFRFFYPKFFYRYNSKSISILPAGQALAKELLNISNKDPWVYNYSYADLTLLESNYAYDQITAQLEKPITMQMIITGRVQFDRVYELKLRFAEEKKKLYDNYDYNYENELVIVAPPPNKFAAYGRQTEFRNHSDLISFFLNTIILHTDYDILLCIHPNDVVEEYKIYESNRVKVCHQSFTEVLPFGKLLINDSSATSRLAISANIPVIDYDVYRFNLSFNKLPHNYLYVDNKDAFEHAVSNLEDLALTASQSPKDHEYFGLLDGECSNRILWALEQIYSV